MIINFREELIRLTDERLKLETENAVNEFFRQLIEEISHVPSEHLLSGKCDLHLQCSERKISFSIIYSGECDLSSGYKTHFNTSTILDAVIDELEKQGFIIEKKDVVVVHLGMLV